MGGAVVTAASFEARVGAEGGMSERSGGEVDRVRSLLQKARSDRVGALGRALRAMNRQHPIAGLYGRVRSDVQGTEDLARRNPGLPCGKVWEGVRTADQSRPWP